MHRGGQLEIVGSRLGFIDPSPPRRRHGCTSQYLQALYLCIELRDGWYLGRYPRYPRARDWLDRADFIVDAGFPVFILGRRRGGRGIRGDRRRRRGAPLRRRRRRWFRFVHSCVSTLLGALLGTPCRLLHERGAAAEQRVSLPLKLLTRVHRGLVMNLVVLTRDHPWLLPDKVGRRGRGRFPRGRAFRRANAAHRARDFRRGDPPPGTAAAAAGPLPALRPRPGERIGVETGGSLPADGPPCRRGVRDVHARGVVASG